jgi:hypothetical protein
MLRCGIFFVFQKYIINEYIQLMHNLNIAIVDCSFSSKSKGKAIPLQAWAGLEGSKSLRLPDFKTIGT